MWELAHQQFPSGLQDIDALQREQGISTNRLCVKVRESTKCVRDGGRLEIAAVVDDTFLHDEEEVLLWVGEDRDVVEG